MTSSIVAIATASGGQAVYHGPLRAEAVYQIDDDAAFIYLACGTKVTDGIRESKAADWPAGLPALAKGSQWWQLSVLPANTLAEDRPLGYGHLELKRPAAKIHYYLWPRRLFGFAQWIAMMRDIEKATGVSPWSEGEGTHTAVENVRGDAHIRCSRFLATLKLELRAAAYLSEHPYVELWAEDDSASHRLPNLPENRLVAQWLRRRLPHLDEVVRSLEHWLTELDASITNVADNHMRRKGLQKERREWMKLRSEGQRLRVRLRRLAILSECSRIEGSLSLTPAMFRDHRLRVLLAALRPTPKERLSRAIAQRSALPPLLAPRLFELWGAVWVVKCLQANGWVGPPPKCIGPSEAGMAGSIHRAQWRLVRGEYTLLLDWSPDPRVVPPSPVTKRMTDALSCSASQLGPATNDDGEVFATRPSTPDYLVRLSGPRGRALGIGDATLSDSRYQNKGIGRSKVEKVSRYVREIGWRAAGTAAVTRCAPLGLFLLLPGAIEDWSTWQQAADVFDCHLFAVTPGEGADAAAEAVSAWINHLILIAESPRLTQSVRVQHVGAASDPTAHDTIALPS